MKVTEDTLKMLLGKISELETRIRALETELGFNK